MSLSLDEAAFVAAIHAAPNDDAPRLVYADWLDERGDPRACDQRLMVKLKYVLAQPNDDEPRLKYAEVCEAYGRSDRAEFVRVQCALARFDTTNITIEPDRIIALRRRERELVQDSDWFSVEPLCITARIGYGHVDQSEAVGRAARGFLESIQIESTDWFEHADDLVWHPGSDRHCPPTAQPIREVRLTTLPYLEILEVGGDYIEFRFPPRPPRKLAQLGGFRLNEYSYDKFLAAEWPGITFHLPVVIHTEYDAQSRGVAQRFLAGPEELLRFTARGSQSVD